MVFWSPGRPPSSEGMVGWSRKVVVEGLGESFHLEWDARGQGADALPLPQDDLKNRALLSKPFPILLLGEFRKY